MMRAPSMSPLLMIAPGRANLRVFGVFRHLRHGQVIGDTLAVFEPLLVGRGDGQHVRIIDLLDEIAGLFHQGTEGGDLFHVDGGQIFHVDCGRDATHAEVLDVRIFTAQDRAHLGRLALIIKRLQVMGHGHQVGFRAAASWPDVPSNRRRRCRGGRFPQTI